MRVGVIGGGSIGLLYAAYLSKTYNVTIFTKTEKQADDLNKNGILLNKGNEQIKIPALAMPLNHWTGQEHFTIIAVKQYQLQPIIDKIANFPRQPDSFLFLQNGMAHIRQLQSMNADNLFVGTVEHGALRENSHTVSHNGEALTNVAVYKGSGELLRQFIEGAPAEFPFRLQDDYYKMLVNKLIINAVVNPLTAILHVENGGLINNPYYFRTLTNLFKEVSNILDIANPEENFSQIINVCKNTAQNRSSMLKDIEAGRKTEVEAILGFLLDEALQHDKEAVMTQTLYDLIKGMEQTQGGVQL